MTIGSVPSPVTRVTDTKTEPLSSSLIWARGCLVSFGPRPTTKSGFVCQRPSLFWIATRSVRGAPSARGLWEGASPPTPASRPQAGDRGARSEVGGFFGPPGGVYPRGKNPGGAAGGPAVGGTAARRGGARGPRRGAVVGAARR